MRETRVEATCQISTQYTCREPNQRVPVDKDHTLHIYPMDSQSYESCVLSPIRGLITLVLLVDNTTKQGEELNAYGKILSRHRYGNLRLFYVSYHKHWRWLFDLLSQCPQLTRNEVAWRVRGCVNGGVATAVLLFGAKKQLVLFPECFDVVLKLCRGLEEGIDRRGKQEKGGREEKEEVEVMGEEEEWEEIGGEETRGGKGRLGVKDENVVVRNKTNRPVVRNRRRKSELGGILGSVFGYESSGEESGDHSSDPNQHSEDDGDVQLGRRGVEEVEEVDFRPAHAAGSVNSVHHEPCSPSVGHTVEQVSTNFENWCEKMADGSLRRCDVEVWPEWTHS